MTRQAVALLVYGAHHPRDAGNAAGREHLVVASDLSLGRLKREDGDALCKSRHKFWGLYANPDRAATCKRCLAIAARHALILPEPENNR
jgi:hypothetical protein